ncbi:MAG: hypothetical protein ACD_54C01055G0001 [uncultured bacterium]|nr:MAG: hypothetical protein ACD_54C01055G0001 [uncultured bacterium]
MVSNSAAAAHFRLFGDIGEQAVSDEEIAFQRLYYSVFFDYGRFAFACVQHALHVLEERLEQVEIRTRPEIGPVIWQVSLGRGGDVAQADQIR